MQKKYKSVPLKVRMSPGIHSALVKLAKRNKRSLNNELLWRLWVSVGKDVTLTPFVLPQKLQVNGLAYEFGDSINPPKMGRPVKAPPKEVGRVPLGLRVSATIKVMLDEAAQKSGRSQSQEAELRIEQSFRDDEIVRRIICATSPQPRD